MGVCPTSRRTASSPTPCRRPPPPSWLGCWCSAVWAGSSLGGCTSRLCSQSSWCWAWSSLDTWSTSATAAEGAGRGRGPPRRQQGCRLDELRLRKDRRVSAPHVLAKQFEGPGLGLFEWKPLFHVGSVTVTKPMVLVLVVMAVVVGF